jgi:hypothetical protein
MSFNTVLHGSGNDRYYGRPGRYGFAGATNAEDDGKVGEDHDPVEDENDEDYEDEDEEENAEEDESFYCAVCFDFGHDASECDVKNNIEPPRQFRCSNCDGYDRTAYQCPSSEVFFVYKDGNGVCLKAWKYA